MNGMPSAPVTCLSSPAVSKAICLDSTTQGPAITNSGRSNPTSNPQSFMVTSSPRALTSVSTVASPEGAPAPRYDAPRNHQQRPLQPNIEPAEFHGDLIAAGPDERLRGAVATRWPQARLREQTQCAPFENRIAALCAPSRTRATRTVSAAHPPKGPLLRATTLPAI